MDERDATHPTDDRCDEALMAILRTQSPQQKLAALDAMWHSARTLVMAGVRAQHPEWSQAELDREVGRRLAAKTD